MTEMDARLLLAFAALRAESGASPRPPATARARMAMHEARSAAALPRIFPVHALRLRAGVARHRRSVAVGGLVAGLGVVASLGWNAGAGTPLYAVRVAHERLSLALPGSDRVGLELAYAEDRLREAREDESTAALDDARDLLEDVRASLPAGSERWARWEDDERSLADLRANNGESVSDETGAAPPGTNEGGGAAGDEPGSSGAAPGAGGGPGTPAAGDTESAAATGSSGGGAEPGTTADSSTSTSSSTSSDGSDAAAEPSPTTADAGSTGAVAPPSSPNLDN